MRHKTLVGLFLALLLCGCGATHRDLSKHDYIGNHPIDPPYCIHAGIVYMPDCPGDGGHQMVWSNGKWVCYIEGCPAANTPQPPKIGTPPLCKEGYWNPEDKVCQNVPYCPKSGCAPVPANSKEVT